MNQKKEGVVKKHILGIASIIVNDEAESQKLAKIQALIKDGTLDLSSNLSLFGGQTCLHLAVEKNLMLIASLLINAGANINATNWKKYTPLHTAVRCGLDNMVILFYNANLNVRGGKRQETPLHLAIRKNFPACVAVLLSFAKPADCSLKNRDDKTPLNLIEEITDEQAKTAFQQALLPNLKPKGLSTAITNKNWTAVFDYINSGLPVSVTYAHQSSAIIQAAEIGSADILLLLCQQPEIDMNATDEDGETALHKSIRYKHIDCIKILVTALKPVNRNYRNKLGKTAEDLVDELYCQDDQKVLREALIYLPTKKRTSEYESFFFSNDNKTLGSDKQDLLLSANFKCLELYKLNHSKIPLSEAKKNVPENKHGASDAKESSFKEILDQHEKKLHKLVLAYGLETSYPESEVTILNKEDFQKIATDGKAQEVPVDAKCLQAIYHICMGTRVNKQLQINFHDILASTLGLLSLHNPLEIVRGLILLSPIFCNHQHLVGNLLVRNVIISSYEFGFNLFDKQFDTTILFYLNNCCLNDISQAIFVVLNRVNEHFFALTCINSNQSLSTELLPNTEDSIIDKIQFILNKKDTIRQDEARYLAREIGNLTLGFYQECFLSSYNENRKKVNLDDSFSMLKDQFDLLTLFIAHIILQQKTAKIRARAITLFALTAKECLHLEPAPDLNSLAFIMSALSLPYINRLKKSFELVDQKTLKIIDALHKLSRYSDNYKLFRDFCKSFPNSLPYIGIILKDITMLGEADSLYNNLGILGEVYLPVVNLKKMIEDFKITRKSDFVFQLKNCFYLNADVFYELSYLYEPEILDLTKNVNLESFTTMLTKFKNNQIPLMIMHDSKCLQGARALEEIAGWLKVLVKTNIIDSKQSEKIYKDCKIYVMNFKNENYSKQIEATNSKFNFFVEEVPRAASSNKGGTMEYSA